uniref:PEGA domain-containing protein n=1 Tax=candidate division CPR3 bacterium TaxID=2268181 RepID=A0A7C4R501_UNCC3
MDNQNPINPDEIKSKNEQNIPISPNIPAPSPELSTGQYETPKIETPSFEAPKPTMQDIQTPAEKIEGLSSKQFEIPPIEPQKMTFEVPLTSKKRLIAGILTGIGLLAIIAVGVYYFAFLRTGAVVTVNSNQGTLDLLIDGNEYNGVNAPYKINLKKGNHTITAKKDGFTEITKELNVESRNKTYMISFELQGVPKPVELFAKKAEFPTYNKDTRNLLFFEKTDDGYFLKEYNTENKTETNLINNMGEVKKVAWSPSNRQLTIKVVNRSNITSKDMPFLAQYGEDTKINWSVNLERKDLVNISTKSLHPSIKNITFNPLGTKIAYLFQNDTDKNLSIAETDGSNYERIVEFKTIEFEPDFTWSPDGTKIAIFANMSEGLASKAKNPDISVYSFETRKIIKVSDDGASYGGLFSPDGKYLLYISGTDLMVFDLSKESEKSKSLGIQTSIEKVVWKDNQTMILADVNGDIYRFSVGGVKEKINYDKSIVSGNIKNILINEKYIFIISENGVYSLDINQTV